ncbi:unnamed protein product, partial [Mesorhabditis belari]|uniref:SAC domain-containing protein n=1 Tax=Mesorhabditis belari TaxID=2138241 RepID=A0AAF3J906_9BILA
MPSRLRRVTVYETSTRFYIVGSDVSRTRFNLLKIDRLESKALLTGEPENDYSEQEIMELLATVSEGTSIVQKGPNGRKQQVAGGIIARVQNAYGILGIVRFTEGYYIILITKAMIVAQIGYHSIYKIAEVAMINIGIDGLLPNSPEEQRYVKIFQSVDLSTDFYFSYTYDLSHSLQENYLATDWENGGLHKHSADSRFIWNSFLLEPLRQNAISERWMIEVTHGFVAQHLVDLPTCQISLILIGRRSAKYAGTRFLKRGANLKGDVANDVETEQIVWDRGGPPNLKKGRFTSFVQRRGSVPLRWSQDPATRGVVGKPMILIDIHEPHAQTAGAHFRDLKKKYGSPIVVYNLVKRREKRRHETLLNEQFLKAVNYLNQFIPDDEQIAYIAFDVARCNKSSDMNVLSMLNETAMRAVIAHGWFQSFPMHHKQTLSPREAFLGFNPTTTPSGQAMLQRGVSRTNCVDCLDRTNVAQFAIGKAALACQLFGMGLLDEPFIDLSSELCRVYEELFDAHGDTLAWQYAGSQLVHSIKTYKKTAALQERSRDVLQTLSRYYSNTFGDYDKQAAINLFLGIYRPQITCQTSLWDLSSDYYLHFRPGTRVTTDYCGWMYDEDELEEIIKQFELVDLAIQSDDPQNKQIVSLPPSRDTYAILCTNSDDEFRDFYRTFEFTPLENRVKQQIYFDQKKVVIGGINDVIASSGFALWKKTETIPMPQKPGKNKFKGQKGQLTDEEDDEIEDETQKDAKQETVIMEEAFERLCPPLPSTFNRKEKEGQMVDGGSVLFSGLRSRRSTYGVEKLSSGNHDLEIYNHYVQRAGITVDPEDWQKYKPTLLTKLQPLSEVPMVRRMTSIFIADSAMQSEIPEVSLSSMRVYNRSTNPQQWTLSQKDQSLLSPYLLYPLA